MKIKNRPYEKGIICNGCKKAYLINQHLLECDEIKMRNTFYLLLIRAFFIDNDLNYKFSDIFDDYGLKNLVKIIT